MQGTTGALPFRCLHPRVGRHVLGPDDVDQLFFRHRGRTVDQDTDAFPLDLQADDVILLTTLLALDDVGVLDGVLEALFFGSLRGNLRPFLRDLALDPRDLAFQRLNLSARGRLRAQGPDHPGAQVFLGLLKQFKVRSEALALWTSCLTSMSTRMIAPSPQDMTSRKARLNPSVLRRGLRSCPLC